MTDKTKDIQAAVGQLDHANLSDWEANGKPRLDRVREVMADETITQTDLDAAAPDYVRDPEVPTGPNDGENQPEFINRGDMSGQELSAASPSSRSLIPEEKIVVAESAEDIAAKIERAKSEVANLSPQIEDIQQEQIKLTERLNALQKERDKHLDTMNRYNINASTEYSIAYKAYLAQQHKNAHEQSERVAVVNAALASVGAHTLKTPASPLDAAMARKTGYGGGRKKFPMLGGEGVQKQAQA